MYGILLGVLYLYGIIFYLGGVRILAGGDVVVIGRKGIGNGGCWSMEMGGREEDLDTNVSFLFLSLFSDGKFTKFVLSVMEGYYNRLP